MLVTGAWRVYALAADEVPSGTYSLDPSHSYVTFSYSHMGFSNPILQFKNFSGEISYDANSLSNSSVSITIDATSIDGGFKKFNDDLRAEDFFDTKNYPEIRFSSTSYEVTGKVTGRLTGNLEVKNVSQPVTLNVTFNRAAINPMMEAPVLGFSAEGNLSRTSFGLDKYTPMVGDTILVTIESEFAGSK